MDLEVVGRHALLFDDDSMAAFVNSGDALVDWHSLNIDRYDVRHLLSAPPPPRGRNRKSAPLRVDDLWLEAQVDHERYLDLSALPDQPDVQEEENKLDTDYRAVTFSYGNMDDSADQKNADAGMESSGFHPPFPVPEDLLPCLPHSEKLHQIIARTAMFVSRHGGQSEIILRVKQGDNPTFGFLMPGHHLHAYFRYLVEHPDLLHSESHGNSRDDRNGSEQNTSTLHGVVGALSLLGSVYGSGEDEDVDNTEEKEKGVSQESIHPANNSSSLKSKKIQADAEKCDSVVKNPLVSNKEKVLTVKRSSDTVPRFGRAKGLDGKSPSGSAAADKSTNSEIEPVLLEPPPDLKILIGKLCECIMRNGKQFESNLIEQDREHGRFPFLLPSSQYYPYYLKILLGAQELKVNGAHKDDNIGRGKDKNSSDSSSLTSAGCDVPWESDRKEKFKMVINKSRKEALETESNGTQQESGLIVDAAAAAAILQAATRGMDSNFHVISRTSPSAHVNGGNGVGGQDGIGRISPSQSDKSVEKSGQGEHGNVPEVANNADSSGMHLTKEQMLKAERLKRAKMFVAMLRSGDVASKTGRSRCSSLEPLAPVVSRDAICGKEREGILVPGDVDGPDDVQKSSKNYFSEERAERDSKRKYRSRYDGGEDDGNGDDKEDNEGITTTDFRSKSMRDDRADERENFVKSTEKHQRRRHRDHSSENDERESCEENRDHKSYEVKYRSHYSHQEYESEKQEDKHGRPIKKSHSHDSSREHSKKRHSSKRHVREKDKTDDDRREQTKSRKKHRSHHSRDHHKHRSKHSTVHKESQHRVKQGDTSSDDEHRPRIPLDKHDKELHYNRDALEEGEINFKVLEESGGNASNNASRETSVRASSLLQSAPSEPSNTSAEVPDDLRAKVQAWRLQQDSKVHPHLLMKLTLHKVGEVRYNFPCRQINGHHNFPFFISQSFFLNSNKFGGYPYPFNEPLIVSTRIH